MLGILVGICFIITGIIIGIATTLYSKKVPMITSCLISIMMFFLMLQTYVRVVCSADFKTTHPKANLLKKVSFIISSFPVTVEMICSKTAELLQGIIASKPTTKTQYRSVVNKRAFITNSILKNMAGLL